jgi:hypothetical protein
VFLDLAPSDFSRRPLERCLTPQKSIKRVSQIANEVPTIGYLHSIGCSQSPSLSIGSSAIPTDDFDSRMLLQPTCKGFGTAICQQIDGPMRVRSTKMVP